MDDNGNGLVSKNEFFCGLKSLKVPYYELFGMDEEQLFKVLDDDHNQNLTMQELLGEEEDHIDHQQFANLPLEQKASIWWRKARLRIKQEMARKPAWAFVDSEQEMRYIFEQAANREYHDQRTNLMRQLFKKGERRREVVARHLPQDASPFEIERQKREMIDHVCQRGKRVGQVIRDLANQRATLRKSKHDMMDIIGMAQHKVHLIVSFNYHFKIYTQLCHTFFYNFEISKSHSCFQRPIRPVV